MFEPHNDNETILTKVRSLKQYIARTDLFRPRLESKEDIETILKAQDCYLFLEKMVTEGKPKSEWISKFSELFGVLQNNRRVLFSDKESFARQKFDALISDISQFSD